MNDLFRDSVHVNCHVLSEVEQNESQRMLDRRIYIAKTCDNLHRITHLPHVHLRKIRLYYSCWVSPYRRRRWQPQCGVMIVWWMFPSFRFVAQRVCCFSSPSRGEGDKIQRAVPETQLQRIPQRQWVVPGWILGRNIFRSAEKITM